MGAGESPMEPKVKLNDKFESENIYCTILTKARVYQGIAMLMSLNQVIRNPFTVFVYCVDDETYSLFEKLSWDYLVLIHENKFPEEIRAIKEKRKIHEYCWTLKPVLCEYVMIHYPSVKRVTYLDSDLYFWEDPDRIFQNQPKCSVLLSIEEKYRPKWKKSRLLRRIKITGLYNSGFISFKQDEIGLQSVKWWKKQCLNNCSIDLKKGLFGDQKYLDELPKWFPKVCPIATPGVNIGPWNYLKYRFTKADQSIHVNDQLLIFYHFSSLRVIDKDHIKFIYRVKKDTLPFIFGIYKKALSDAVELAEKIDPHFNGFATKTDLTKYWN